MHLSLTRMALMSVAATAFVLTANFSPAAQAGPYGGSKGGDAFGGRYEKYLEEEAKREKAKAQSATKRNQQAGDVPATLGGPVIELDRAGGAPGRVLFDRHDQRNRGR